MIYDQIIFLEPAHYHYRFMTLIAMHDDLTITYYQYKSSAIAYTQALI